LEQRNVLDTTEREEDRIFASQIRKVSITMQDSMKARNFSFTSLSASPRTVPTSRGKGRGRGRES